MGQQNQSISVTFRNGVQLRVKILQIYISTFKSALHGIAMRTCVFSLLGRPGIGSVLNEIQVHQVSQIHQISKNISDQVRTQSFSLCE